MGERLALGLPVVGQRDEQVAPRRELGGPVEPPDLAVDLAEHAERVEPLDAGVVGDLVVAEEIGVHAGPAVEHVPDDRRDDDVAGDHVGAGPRERVEPAAVDARPHSRRAAADRRGDLADDVGDRRRPGCARRCRGWRSRRSSPRRRLPRRRPRLPEPASSGTALIVRLTCGASPVKRLPREAPSTARRPRPSAWRRSISAASSGCAQAITWSRSFSYQRKPRMSSLRPCRMPHTLAPVWELQSQCHSVSAWLPWASQRANVGMSPSRTARRTVSKPRPSTCRNSTPGGRSSGWCRCCGGRRGGRRSRLRRGRAGSTRAPRPPTSPPRRPPRCPGPRSPRPGSRTRRRAAPRPSAGTSRCPACRPRRAARPGRSAATRTAESTPNASAITVGCHHCGIAKPGSHASSRRSASTDTSQTSSTRATTRPPRTIRPLMSAASAAAARPVPTPPRRRARARWRATWRPPGRRRSRR